MEQKESRGYVQVYTGDGKGKTTAAIGLAVRALGAGKRVLFLQFMKRPDYSEHRILTTLTGLKVIALGKPYFVARADRISPEAAAAMGRGLVVFEPGKPPEDYVRLLAEGLEAARVALTGGEYDLVVLDELNVALSLGLVELDEVLKLLDARAANVEVVITGRGAPPALLERADLVTEMREAKHYFRQGVPARRGIEN
ncbi:MAG TPA: cob(I)yrinic acid a,c-diamide adenosyltransferase [Firmicutes bacterium]|nr:cob(I)yrinic acid a,c-diamide adenosyltransferase [Bacillota bacterium]